jgi:hypothetical protein
LLELIVSEKDNPLSTFIKSRTRENIEREKVVDEIRGLAALKTRERKWGQELEKNRIILL